MTKSSLSFSRTRIPEQKALMPKFRKALALADAVIFVRYIRGKESFEDKEGQFPSPCKPD